MYRINDVVELPTHYIFNLPIVPAYRNIEMLKKEKGKEALVLA